MRKNTTDRVITCTETDLLLIRRAPVSPECPSSLFPYSLLFRLIHASPAAAPAAITATLAGPVSPAGPLDEVRMVLPQGSKTRRVAKSGEPEEGGWKRGFTGEKDADEAEEKRVEDGGATALSLRQKTEQPSPLSRLPSSHSSLRSQTLSPQRGREQSVRQRLSGVSAFCFPASHSSPRSMTPLPQNFSRKRQAAVQP